jgi:PAS domain S-box-containing protein
MPSPAVWQRPNPLRVLVEASASLLETPELSSVVPKILDLATHIIQAEAYAVWRTVDGNIWKILSAKGLSPAYMAEALQNQGAISTPVLLREPIVIDDLASHPFFALRHSLYEAEGIASMMVVPLMIHGKPEGTITFYWKARHSSSTEDVQYAVALANLAAAAINTAELYEHQVLEERRSRFLAEASTLLASSLDYEETLRQVAQMAVPTIADWCSVRILENGHLTRTAVAHSDPAKLAWADEYAQRFPDDPKDSTRGLGRVLATGEAEMYSVVTEAMLLQGASNEEHLALLRKLGMKSVIMVPLAARDRILGALTLISAESGRHFDENDLRLAQDLARRAAIAVENAQLHRELMQSEARFRSLVEQSPMSTAVFDPEGHPVEANPAFAKLFGATLAEAPPGYSVFDDPQLQAAGLIPLIRRAFEGEQVALPPARYDTALTSTSAKGNSFWAEAVLYPIRDASGKIARVVMLQMDVTEKMFAEQKRAATEASLRNAEKLATAGRLAATVAHEINNPLEAITNILFLVRNDGRIPSDLGEYLVTADEELRRVAHIVRQTLGFYRENVAPEPVDISGMVDDIVHLYKRRIEGKRIRVTTHLLPDALVVAVAGEIRQVIANLLTNAIDACSEGTSVDLSVDRMDGYIRMVVRDNGTGINSADQPHVFEPFFTTKKDVGTGLGLWVSREIVDRHRGKITFESRTPTAPGTAFTVLLPVS